MIHLVVTGMYEVVTVTAMEDDNEARRDLEALRRHSISSHVHRVDTMEEAAKYAKSLNCCNLILKDIRKNGTCDHRWEVVDRFAKTLMDYSTEWHRKLQCTKCESVYWEVS